MNEEQKTKSDQPLVSVCIGVYNREQYIRDTLDSVFAQTYPNLEVIVVDDASTDGTVDILREYGDCIEIIIRQENSGLPAVPRNQAIRRAGGDCIAFLDSDDCWMPEKIEKQVEFMNAHPEVMLVHVYCRLIDEDGREGGIRHEGVVPPTGFVLKEMLRHFTIATSAMMIRRAWFESNEMFSENIEQRAREDFELCLRVAAAHPIGFIPEMLVCYRRANTGISQEPSSWQARPRDIPALLLARKAKSVWRDQISAREFQKIIQDACCENALYWRDQRNTYRALWAIGQGMRVAPFSPALWREAVKTLGRAVWSR